MNLGRILYAATALGAVGCGNALDCAINGDNLEGRVTFAQGIQIHSTAPLVVQYSSDSFATNSSSTFKTNPHGLPTVPFGFCVPEGTYQLRAFQDLNGNGTLDSGESSGRNDDTVDGNATYANETVTTTGSTYNRVTGIEIRVDTP